MNWKLGLLRLWVVATAGWLVAGVFIFAEDFTATTSVQYSEELGAPPVGLNKYDCLLTKAACPGWRMETRVATAPDWDLRIRALLSLFGLPIMVPLLGWAIVRVATWIAQGFRQGRAS